MIIIAIVRVLLACTRGRDMPFLRYQSLVVMIRSLEPLENMTFRVVHRARHHREPRLRHDPYA